MVGIFSFSELELQANASAFYEQNNNNYRKHNKQIFFPMFIYCPLRWWGDLERKRRQCLKLIFWSLLKWIKFFSYIYDEGNFLMFFYLKYIKITHHPARIDVWKIIKISQFSSYKSDHSPSQKRRNFSQLFLCLIRTSIGRVFSFFYLKGRRRVELSHRHNFVM